MRPQLTRSAWAILGLLLAMSCQRLAPAPPRPGAGAARLAGGPTVGEVTATSAVLWARCDGAATVTVAIDGVEPALTATAAATSDYVVKVRLQPLHPRTRYRYRVDCGDAATASDGSFRTAPAADDPAGVRFVWSGDLGGQNVCRDRELGYPIFAPIAARHPDFFIGLGDMIYADDGCDAVGRFGNAQIAGPPAAVDLAGFRAHWRYNWEDPHFQQLRRTTPYLGVWDDHEIRNDSGPHDDLSAQAPPVHLLPPALQAFLEYQPLLPPADDPTRLYRSIRWGQHLAVFLLDTRQYRDALGATDRPERPKTMLGAAQLAWLEDALAHSDATWNVIVASVPLSIPTGSRHRDGFADGGGGAGYEQEAAQLLRMLHEHQRGPTLWITTDVHFATGFRYRPFTDDPSWAAYELVTGPLNAGIFPTSALDPTFRPERLFTYAPPSADAIRSFADAVGWFNFGTIDIAADGTLTVSVSNGHGEAVYSLTLPRPGSVDGDAPPARRAPRATPNR